MAEAEVFSLRLPRDSVKRLRRIARLAGKGPTQLARGWILERLAEESRRSVVREPAQSYAAQDLGSPLDRRGEIAAACRKRGVKRLGLFGSAVRDDFDPVRSDLDFTVEYLDMPVGLLPAAYFGLIADLEGLFERRIDLVDRKTLTNPYLRAAIESEEVTIFETP